MIQDKALDFGMIYKNALLEDILPFWEQNSLDWEYGGYFTSLERNGEVYDTDKFSWLQARQAWTFAFCYNKMDQRDQWLDISRNGINFLRDHGRDEAGHFYFSFDRQGRPLTQAYNIYSDCFAALAFTEYAKASGDEEALEIGLQAYRQFLSRQDHPKGRFTKATGLRKLSSFGLPMMTAYLTYELEPLLKEQDAASVYESCLDLILHQHYRPDQGLIYENIGTDGKLVDSYDGRLINPGHGIEAMWFLMEIAEKLDRPQLIAQLTDICLSILTHSWDEKHGGIFYFMDARGKPLQQLEWDQKLWWVHQEALIALALAYCHTQRADVWTWWLRVHEYTWNHFPDPEYGEWYGYLNREGSPFLSLKGGKWKGCFHSPRAMYKCWQAFQSGK